MSTSFQAHKPCISWHLWLLTTKLVRSGAQILAILTVIAQLCGSVAYAKDDPRGIKVVFGESRTALVIGNSAYLSDPLRNPVNDALDIARMLEQRKFDVMLLTDADKAQMAAAIETFGEKLTHGGIGLFFYAGHAMQVEGTNYLMPIDSAPRKEGDVKHQAIDAGLVLTELDSSRNRLNLVILDACRDNPFARSFRSGTRGLARMDAPRGTLIAYSTSPSKTAADGDGVNSVYTKHLLEQMSVPGQEMQTMFKRVRAAVDRETGGAQTTEEWDRVTGDFYFTPIDFLAQDLELTTAELARYRKLLAEQQAADDRIRKLEADKTAAIARMEQEIEALRQKIAQPGSADSTLDELIAIGKRREQYQKDLEAARVRAEEERREREAELARLRAQELAKRKKRFEAEYEKYRWIVDSEFMQPAEKQQAWELICKNWNVTDAPETPGRLRWDDNTGTAKPLGSGLSEALDILSSESIETEILRILFIPTIVVLVNEDGVIRSTSIGKSFTNHADFFEAHFKHPRIGFQVIRMDPSQFEMQMAEKLADNRRVMLTVGPSLIENSGTDGVFGFLQEYHDSGEKNLASYLYLPNRIATAFFRTSLSVERSAWANSQDFATQAEQIILRQVGRIKDE